MAGRKSKSAYRGTSWKGMLLAETRTVVMQEFFDEVYMGEDHTPTAVSFKL
jgi:hypothetical protein